MYPQSRTIRGLGIANVILSGIGVFLGLILVWISFIVSAQLSDPATASKIAEQVLSSSSGSMAFDGNSAYSYNYSYSGMTGQEALAIVTAAGPLVIGSAFAFLILTATGLVAAILALRNYNNPAKLGGAFGWSIVAAIASFFAGGWVSTVLFIVAAVYIGKLRRAWKEGAFDNNAGSQGGAPQPPVAQ